MFIKNINYLDANIKEAVVVVSEGLLELSCFSDSCSLAIGDVLNDALECLDVSNIETIEDSYEIIKLNGPFDYLLKGKLINKMEGIVNIGGILIHIDEDEIPNDIEEGMYISFETSRIDIW